MRYLVTSLLCVLFVLLTGCVGHTLRDNPEETLNQALICDAPYCPYRVEVDGSQVRLLSGYRLVVNSVDLATPGIKDQSIYQLSENDAAPNVFLPSISTFEFLVPEEHVSVSRSEALFVAFLLAAAFDEDEMFSNPGRDYSARVDAAKTRPEAVDELVRQFTSDMRIRFPTIESDQSHLSFDRFRTSYCSSAGKAGKSAPIDVRTLEFTGIDASGQTRVFHVGSGLDWTYSWTTGDVLEEEVNTSVVLTDDVTNKMFGFEVRFDLRQIDHRPSITVDVCESLGAVADRIDRQPRLLTRDCRVAPVVSAYQGGGFKKPPCSKSGERLTIRLDQSMALKGRFVDVDPGLADRLLLLPGDEVLFGK